MHNVTQILNRLENGDSSASEELLPLVYDELRRLAAARLRNSANVLQPTVLVHEAYLRLVDVENPPTWNGRGHFFAAAARSMRRIVVEETRRNGRIKRGGDLNRIAINADSIPDSLRVDVVEMLTLNDAIEELSQHDPVAARLIELRYFGGFPMKDAREVLGIGRRQADGLFKFARAWLFRKLSHEYNRDSGNS